MNKQVFISAHASATALGCTKKTILQSLKETNPVPHSGGTGDRFSKPYYSIPEKFEDFPQETRSVQITYYLFDTIKDYFKTDKSIPLFMATSTGGIDETEDNYENLIAAKSNYSPFDKHFFNYIINKINERYENKFSNALTFSTACSSSGHALLQAFRLIQKGIIKKAMVFGIDILSHTTMTGFDSLQLVSPSGSKPLTTDRDGLTLGEGAGIVLLDTQPSDSSSFEIVGAASSSDGHHISSPDPEGKSQRACIVDALTQANLSTSDIDYINAHGTGTKMNDEVEIKTLKTLFENTPVSSLKSFIGHTLGASTIAELSLCIHSIQEHMIFQPKNFINPMDEIVLKTSTPLRVQHFIKNSFGFGGNNISLVIKNNAYNKGET